MAYGVSQIRAIVSKVVWECPRCFTEHTAEIGVLRPGSLAGCTKCEWLGHVALP